jgi:CheY-like chemotaxis protein
VEDEALVCTLIEDFLEALGYEVIATAARLEEALVKATTLSMDVAILDVNLGGQLSYPVAKTLEARNIPFLFATGYGATGLSPDFRGVPILNKPFGIPQLENALHAATMNVRPQ